MKRYKSGFTIAELMLTTVIFATLCVVTPIIVLKKNSNPEITKEFDFIAQCKTPEGCNSKVKCVFDASTAEITTYCGNTKAGIFDNHKSKNTDKFYAIELIGGGGDGTANSKGCPGISKTIYIPVLKNNTETLNTQKDEKYKSISTGYYLIEIGSTEKSEANKAKSGNDTRLCIIKKNYSDNVSCNDSESIIIATAQGGITSNEADDSEETITDSPDFDIFKGSENIPKWGLGGEIQETGTEGTAIIR